jgi:hypothetical protein
MTPVIETRQPPAPERLHDAKFRHGSVLIRRVFFNSGNGYLISYSVREFGWTSLCSTVETSQDVTSRQAMQMSVVSKFSDFENLYSQMLFFSTGDPSLWCPAPWSKTSIRRGHFSPPQIDQRGV